MEPFENQSPDQSTQDSHGSIESLTSEKPTTSNSIEIPKIELPKGGGALKGIDEKFKVNAANGTGAFSIPLPFSPGRHGFTPLVSLSYNSGNGNGAFGMGWSLSFASIQRKTDKKIPRYQDVGEADLFMFTGAEDLVPVLEKSGNDWIEKEYPKNGDGGYTIKRYRPRVEQDFSRIEKIFHSDYGTYWKVTARDNIATIYGRSAEARIANPDDPSQVFQWLPEFSYDDKGNWLKFLYKEEDKANIPEEVYESNRLNGVAKFTNRYLHRIKYGNKTAYYADADLPYDPQPPADNSCFFELVFDYGQYDDLNPQPGVETKSWAYRNDPFSSFRSGFEIRTNRLCKRVLMFHHFQDEKQFVGTAEEENFGVNYLVKSLELQYQPSSINNSGQSETTYLKSVTQSGYIRKPDGTYSKKSLPPVEFSYQELQWSSEVKSVSPEHIMNVPVGLTNNYQWIDLYGEGVSGILTEEADAWYYKRNLGDPEEVGDIQFAAGAKVSPKPSLVGLDDGTLTIEDLESNGQKQIVVRTCCTNGYFQITDEEEWEVFKPFRQILKLDLKNPNLRFVDLTGDGQPDIVITDENAFIWHAANGKEGHAPAVKTLKVFDENEGPSIVFSDMFETIYLADMTGDGLTDIVRIRNGEVCYWANKGYGNFSAKVTMSNAPMFDLQGSFNTSFLHLADVSGTGTTDMLYLGKGTFTAFLNLSGNSWSDAHNISATFPVDSNTKLSVIDLLGKGTSCIVWSTDLPAEANSPMRYIDLMGGKKPHLLIQSKNNLGKESTIHYKSSTHFYLKDKTEGTPWITRLPFPVQVVEKIVVEEKISDTRFTTSYRYRHGHFDHSEREFRGFGLVEQTDSEYYPEWKNNNIDNRLEKSEALYQKPVLTKTWFHTGAYMDRSKILTQHKTEYWFEAYNRMFADNPIVISEPELPDASISDDIKDLPADEFREAMRACKGMVLRKEVFALDAPDNPSDEEIKLQMKPYSVATYNCNIRLLQPRRNNKYGVYLVTESEALTMHYERDESDFRLIHNLNLEIDDVGNVLQKAKVIYGRDQLKTNAEFQALKDSVTDFSEDVLEGDASQMTQLQDAFTNNIEHTKQAQTQQHVIYSKNSYAKFKHGVLEIADIDLPEIYRLRLIHESRNYEVTGITPASEIFTLDELKGIEGATAEIGYQDNSDGTAQRRLIEHIKTRYLDENLDPLDFGYYGRSGFNYESYQLALTPDLTDHIYQKKDGTLLQVGGTDVKDLLEPNGKYHKIDGDFWIRSGFIHYKDDPAEPLAKVKERFYMPVAFENPTGSRTTVRYDVETFAGSDRNNDGYYIYLQSTTDAVDNKVQINVFNYRTLTPIRLIDMNANPTSILVDELGMVKATSVEGNGVFTNASRTAVNILQNADELTGLKEYATLQEENQINQLLATATFNSTDTNQLRQAGNDLLHRASVRFLYNIDAYMSGGGQPTCAVTIVREEHFAENVNSKISFAFEYTDGHGNLIMKKAQAEPGLAYYMEDGIRKEKDTGTDVRWLGSGRTVFNNKGNPVKQYEPYFSPTFFYENAPELVEIGVTPIMYYDSVGRLYKTTFPDGTLTRVEFDSWKQVNFDKNDTLLEEECLWYKRRTDVIRSDFITDPKDQLAAQKAVVHAGTPSLTYINSLGRPVLSIAHNGQDAATKNRLYTTFIDLDVEGNTKSVTDARGNKVISYKNNMLGQRLYQKSMDAGERWFLNNLMGNLVMRWDSKDQLFKTEYDILERPTRSLLGDALIGKITYGESAPNNQRNNLRGRILQSYDSSGRNTNAEFDFKGNLLTVIRQLASSANSQVIDWSSGSSTNNLESETFTKNTEYDALNRTQRLFNWHRDSNNVTVHIPTYNERGILQSEIHVTNADKADVSNTGRSIAVVSHITYNEKGQCTRIRYGNGTNTRYHYDELSFRLMQLKTTKSGASGSVPSPSSNLSDGNVLQNLYYTYDAVGNITEVEDDAFEPVFFMNQQVEAKNRNTYDALYRLTSATGRENKNFNSAPKAIEPQVDTVGFPVRSTTSTDKTLRNYTQIFNYDPVGNILKMRHVSPLNTDRWTRNYDYATDNNRLIRTWTGSSPSPSTTVNYSYDIHGNILNYNNTPEAYLAQWDYMDRVYQLNLGGGGDAKYQYDSNRERSRKLIVKNGSTEERIYLGGTELYRRWNSSNTKVEEIETHHLFFENQRILIVENILQTDNSQLNIGILDRYQYNNLIGSVGMELNSNAAIIGYEEYHPYGTVAYQASNTIIKATKKRYRYSGMERDEESGLNYHSARYYMQWLGRWTSPDPIGIGDGVNIYKYSNASPIRYNDTNGKDAFDEAAPILESIRNTTSGHGFYRGTFEAVLGEAQGLNIIRQPSAGGARPGANVIYDHASQLRDSVQASRNRLTEIGEFLQQVSRTDPDAHRHLSRIFQPLQQQLRGHIRMGNQTLELARELSMHHPNRLSAFEHVSRGRTANSLVSRQLAETGVPHSLVPAGLIDSPDGRELMRAIDNTPLDGAGSSRAARTAIDGLDEAADFARTAARTGTRINRDAAESFTRRFSRRIGHVLPAQLSILSAGLVVSDVAQAETNEERGRVVARAGGGEAGGELGFWGGCAAGALLLSETGPGAGLGCIGGGIIVGFFGGWAGEEIGEASYDAGLEAVQSNESPTMYTPGTYDPQTCDTIMVGGGMRTICH